MAKWAQVTILASKGAETEIGMVVLNVSNNLSNLNISVSTKQSAPNYGMWVLEEHEYASLTVSRTISVCPSARAMLQFIFIESISHIKPVHYSLRIFDLELGGKFSYKGNVQIHFRSTADVKDIMVNICGLQVYRAEVTAAPDNVSTSISLEDITHDETQQTSTFKFPELLRGGDSEHCLSVLFSGTITNDMVGLYRSKYKPVAPQAPSVPRDGEYYCMLSTLFEPCHARRAFPCLDEPVLKATFDFEIEIPKDLVALSNMPEKSVTKAEKANLKVVSFQRSPIMSIYLLSWAVGDLEYCEDYTERQYSGKQACVGLGKFALSNARLVVYFSEMFGIGYPLPKLDLLAVHEFASGAMENWGLITYRTTAILYDELDSDPKFKSRIAYVIAHEIAHQWFGNLTTMDWWSGLWLNEGFATWAGRLATSHFHPEFNIWDQFLADGVQQVYRLDALSSSHSVEIEVKNSQETGQIFDVISYVKGACVIRMLYAYLGRSVFLKGLSNYLRLHAYANATTNDLWSALSEASGIDIKAFMDNWITKIGFPVLIVTEESGKLKLHQSRFSSFGRVSSEEDITVWSIPLSLYPQTKFSNPALNYRNLTMAAKDLDGLYKLNIGSMGFFRTCYPSSRLEKLANARHILRNEDKIGLIGDLTALTKAGYATTADPLNFIQKFQDEEGYSVWLQIITSLTDILSIFADIELIANGLKQFTSELMKNALKIGWEASGLESWSKGQLRCLLLGTVGINGYPDVVSEANQRFNLSIKAADISPVRAEYRSIIFRTVVANGGIKEYEAVMAEYLTSRSVDGKEIALQALGFVKQPHLIDTFMSFLFSEEVAVQDIHIGLSGKLRQNPVVLDRFLSMILQNFAEHNMEEDIISFFKDKDTSAYNCALAVAIEIVRANTSYKTRSVQQLSNWLTSNGYV
ncbi:peptidase family M1-domain-containing protein [Xylogone sp. PMI_703]|nr:peptidase family M1-domain-containing protein [Xylogone sp. PMI_703]